MFKRFRTHLMLVLAIGFVGPVLAQSDPTVQQVYDAARSGHLAQAHQMINQVLQNHPQSGKAHYVAAEIYAREGNFPAGQRELNTAESLEPGLPFARQDSVRALQRELSDGGSMRMQPGYAQPGFSSRVRSAFPWGWALAAVALIAIFWAMLRRRTATAIYNQYPNGAPAPAGVPGYGPGYVPGYPNYGGPGVGSSIAGGLASGLAVGAGVVAGEELAHHFLDGDRREGNVLPAPDPGQVPENGDMGGSDFGISDGSSWDDGGSDSGSFGGDGGGGDWT